MYIINYEDTREGKERRRVTKSKFSCSVFLTLKRIMGTLGVYQEVTVVTSSEGIGWV